MTNNPMMGMMMPQQISRDQGGNVNVYGDVTLISTQSFGVGRQQTMQQMLQQQQNQMLLGLAASMAGIREQHNQNLIEAKKLELEERKLNLAEKAMTKGFLLESDMIQNNESVKAIAGGEEANNIRFDTSKAETVETESSKDAENCIDTSSDEDINIDILNCSVVEKNKEDSPTFFINLNDLFYIAIPYKFKKDFSGNALLVLVNNEFNWKKKLREAFKAQFGSNLSGLPQTIVVKFNEENKIIFIRSLELAIFNRVVILRDNSFFNEYGIFDIYDFISTNIKNDKLKGVDVFIEIDLYVGSVENLRGYPCPLLTDNFDRLVELRSFFEDKPYLIDSELVSKTIRKVSITE